MDDKASRKLWTWLAAVFFLLITMIILAADLGLAAQVFAWVAILPGQDVSMHFILIGGLALLVNMATNRRTISLLGRSIQLGSAVILLLVTLEEFSQIWISTRGFSLFDLSADWLGVWLLGGWGSAKLQAHLIPESAEPPAPLS